MPTADLLKDVLERALKVVKRLETAAKHAAATATQSIAAAQAAGPHNTNPTSQDQLLAACKAVADQIAKLVQGVKGTLANPDSPTAQLALIGASEEFIQVGSLLILFQFKTTATAAFFVMDLFERWVWFWQTGNPMVAAAKTALPTVDDPSSSMQLSNSSKQFSQALTDLRTAAAKARDSCGPLELDSALDMLHGVDDDLDQLRQAVDAANLKPLPGETAEGAVQQLAESSKSVGSSVAQLLSDAVQGDAGYTGAAARNTAAALQNFGDAVRAVAATSDDPAAQHQIIDSAKQVVDQVRLFVMTRPVAFEERTNETKRDVHCLFSGGWQTIKLIEESRMAVGNGDSTSTQQRLAQAAREVSLALSNVINCLPGQKDVDDAIQTVESQSQMLDRVGHAGCL